MAELTIELLSPEAGMAVRQDSGGLSATLLKSQLWPFLRLIFESVSLHRSFFSSIVLSPAVNIQSDIFYSSNQLQLYMRHLIL